MKASDWLWGGLGAGAVGLGVVELMQGQTLLSLSGFVIGAILIATTVSALRRRG